MARAARAAFWLAPRDTCSEQRQARHGPVDLYGNYVPVALNAIFRIAMYVGITTRNDYQILYTISGIRQQRPAHEHAPSASITWFSSLIASRATRASSSLMGGPAAFTACNNVAKSTNSSSANVLDNALAARARKDFHAASFRLGFGTARDLSCSEDVGGCGVRDAGDDADTVEVAADVSVVTAAAAARVDARVPYTF